MQSVVVQLPNLTSILKFVSQGFKDLPGVAEIESFETPQAPPPPEAADEILQYEDMPIRSAHRMYATLRVYYHDHELFAPYLPYIKNFTVILGLVCEERTQRDLNHSLMKNLEQRVEERTRELSDKLEEIRRINVDLEKARAKAEESDRLKSAFLANISHEIRTPMNGILGFSDLLRSEDLDGEERHAFIDNIHASGKRMLRIINDLVDISKIEANQVEFFASDCSLNELLDELQLLFMERFKAKKLHLSCLKPNRDGDDRLVLDRDRLAQIYINLLDNAIKFTDHGQVEFGYHIQDEILHGFVQDSGIGITPDQTEAVFERFRQVKSDKSRLHQGSGLGLSICKAFVELQGGQIHMRSTPEKGTRIDFTIPGKVLASTEAPSPALAPAEPLPDSKLRILLAEDDDANYQLYQAVLSHTGTLYRVTNGQEAIDLIEARGNDFDVVLMDIKMPYVDGLEATRRIKQIQPHLPIIAQTAFAQQTDRQEALAAGCDDCIAKPIDQQQLFRIIRELTSVPS